MGFRNPITTAIDPVARSMAANPLGQIPAGAIAGSKLAADAIDGRTITGALLQSAHTGTQDWTTAGALPTELTAAGYTSGTVYYNGQYVAGAVGQKYVALVSKSLTTGQSVLRVIGCDVNAGGAASLTTLAEYNDGGPGSNATGVNLNTPRTTAGQEALPNSLVRYDYAAPGTPQSVEFSGPANGIVNATTYNVPDGMSTSHATGATIAAPSGGKVTLPAGLWLMTWVVSPSPNLVNGRCFVLANGVRVPIYNPGEDFVSGTQWFSLGAPTAVTFQFFLTTNAAGAFNSTHVLKLVRLGNAT